MRGDNKLTVFASGNGDSILIEAHNHTVMTDIHYRRTQAEDEDKDHVPDFAHDIREACPHDHMDVFVLTHPDKDHCHGFEHVFHIGHPNTHDADPVEGETKIIVDEIWCSPYSTNPHYVTEHAKPILDEIKRRERLIGTLEGTIVGNRLKILDMDGQTTGTVVDGLSWRLLAPTLDEWDIEKAPEGETPTSSNPTSLVIQWTVTVNGGENLILLGGDSTVEVWERIESEIHAADPDAVAWHVMVALHHCSRRSLGRVYNDNHVDEEFIESEEALRALGEKRGLGYVVSSSKRVYRGGHTPPSYHAKNRYLNILAGSAAMSEAIRERFVCVGGHADDDTPTHAVFSLTSKGPTPPQKKKAPATTASAAAAVSSVGRGGGYGR